MDKLPQSREIAEILAKTGKMGLEECLETKGLALGLYTAIQGTVDPEREEEDFDLDPEDELKNLLKIQALIGALVGLTSSLSRRIKTLVYESMTEDGEPLEGRKKKKYTQADKEYSARGAVADLEGLENSLDIAARNVESRIFLLRNAVRVRF